MPQKAGLLPVAVLILGILCAACAYSMGDDTADNGDFVISNNVLVEYRGPGGNVIIPNGVTSIDYSAFSGCSALSSIEIPESVTGITFGVFERCSALESVKLPPTMWRIGYETFAYCESLTDIEIPSSVTSIGSDAFQYCDFLTIHGVTGSYAEEYATQNNIPFSAL